MFARRAKEFDRLDARGFAELGYAKLYRRQHDGAIAEYEQALSLNPNDSDIIAEYADALAYVEQPQRSVELMHKAMRLNPHYPDWYFWYLADAYDTLGQSEDVIATVKRMHDPSEGQRMLAANFAHLGMMSEAEVRRVKSCASIPDSRSAYGASAPRIATRPSSSAMSRDFARPACLIDGVGGAPKPSSLCRAFFASLRASSPTA